MSNQSEKGAIHFDMVIVGGGMVGISLALMLAKQGEWKILLVESNSLDMTTDSALSYSSSFDARSTALSWTSREIYQSIGLWEQLGTHASGINQIHVSDRGHAGITRMTAEEADVDALGYVVENRWLGSVLMNRLKDEAIEICGNTQIDTLKPRSNGIDISMKVGANSSQEELNVRTDLIIIADGADSMTAHKLGINSRRSAYGQTAIIANIQLNQRHQGVAYERFTDQGPMALLPLPDYKGQYRSALVWAQPEETASQLVEATDEDFLRSLQQRFGHRLGTFKQVGQRTAYNLVLTLASEQVRRNVVVMGNAAHSLHPVAGQGFNLSLRDAAALADKLSEARIQQKSIGSLETLECYYQQQRIDQRNTLVFSDSLTKFFAGPSNVAAMGRNSGLLVLDLVPQLRHRFIKFGMGMTVPEARHG
ncbi:2-octaprenyl-6-methoxyphenyl hydroxylase [Porticoccaceae bacterium]|nr:2-octaprenyl-6-methoxyphenyl hydroxylase [Porticoccaceae bacterium]MDB3884480.1 2-octaprenyl-6-methoxyphenyl hydroxylase [Porticoccaceae bacterium]MDC3200492.1 2-octaprenyl-6-methoxyphenyl hydroxylase [Porticoccaceae bacterium]